MGSVDTTANFRSDNARCEAGGASRMVQALERALSSTSTAHGLPDGDAAALAALLHAIKSDEVIWRRLDNAGPKIAAAFSLTSLGHARKRQLNAVSESESEDEPLAQKRQRLLSTARRQPAASELPASASSGILRSHMVTSPFSPATSPFALVDRAGSVVQPSSASLPPSMPLTLSFATSEDNDWTSGSLSRIQDIQTQFQGLCARAPTFPTCLDFNSSGTLLPTPHNRPYLELEFKLNGLVQELDSVSTGSHPTVQEARKTAIESIQAYQSVWDNYIAGLFARPLEHSDLPDAAGYTSLGSATGAAQSAAASSTAISTAVPARVTAVSAAAAATSALSPARRLSAAAAAAAGARAPAARVRAIPAGAAEDNNDQPNNDAEEEDQDEGEEDEGDDSTAVGSSPVRGRSRTAVNGRPLQDPEEEELEEDLEDDEDEEEEDGPPGAGAAGGVRGGKKCHRKSKAARRSARSLVGASAVSTGRAQRAKAKQRDKTQPHARASNARAIRPPTAEVLSCVAQIVSPMAYGSIAHALKMSWSGEDPGTFPVQDDMPDNNMACLRYHARQCADADSSAWLLSLRAMLMELRFALTAQRVLSSESGLVVDSLMEKLSSEVHVPNRTLLQYNSYGLRWAYLLLAGSVPLLLAIALLGLRRKLSRMDMTSLQEFCSIIRNPDQKQAPPYVRDLIVPTLKEWGRCFNLRLGQRTFGQDLAADDALLSSLDLNAWVLPSRSKDWDGWNGSRQLTMFQPCPPDLQPLTPTQWTPPSRDCKEIRIDMADFKKPFSPVAGRQRLGKRLPREERQAQIKQLRQAFAAQERTFAQQNQTRCSSWEDLQSKASQHCFRETGNYLVVPARFAREQQADMKLCHSDGTFIAEILDTSVFSEQEVRPLFEYLRDAMRINPETIPESSEDAYDSFPAVHCVISNKYSENGDDAAGEPVAETADELRGNAHQRLPREHLDLRADLQGYKEVCAVLEKIFQLVAERIKASLPKSYEVLMSYVRALPLGTWSPCYPFAGLVLNFGVMTDPHLDEDLEVCVVITFGNFTGGELGLYEAKLLLELDGFSIVIFPSWKFTHFNLPFSGQRGSIALSTERASQAWTNSRNAWTQYLYTRSKG